MANSDSPLEILSWILRHHQERMVNKFVLPSLNYFKMLEILQVLSRVGPCTFMRLEREIKLLSSHQAILSYLNCMIEIGLVGRKKIKFGGGFAPMKSANWITKKGEALLKLAEDA